MYLTKINELIWVVCLLSCAQAQMKYEATGIGATHDVIENKPIILVCILREDIRIIETSDTGRDMYNEVVNWSKFNETFSDRFSYSYDNETAEHIFVIKNISRTQDGYVYMFTNGRTMRTVTLNVFYKPPPPMCLTNYYTKELNEPTILQCRVELAIPKVFIYISGDTFDTDLYSVDGNYVSRQVTIDNNTQVDIENTTCTVVQYFPYGTNVDYSTLYCVFNDSLSYTTESVTTSEYTTESVTTSENTTESVTTSENTTSEDTTSENTTSEDTTSEDTTSEYTTSENTTSEYTTSEYTTSEDTTSEYTINIDKYKFLKYIRHILKWISFINNVG